MSKLEKTQTSANLKAAFAAEAQANRRYLYFARQADIEGFPEIAGLFRDTAEGEANHANGHLDHLRGAGDPVTGKPIGTTAENLEAAFAGELAEAELTGTDQSAYAREIATVPKDAAYSRIAPMST